MDLGLKDKVVVITGGTQGIGRALVSAFLEEGCRVAACGRDPDRVKALARDCPEVLALPADVGRAEDLRNLAARAAERFGGVDVWINNAGMSCHGSLMDLDEAAWDRAMDVNLKSVFLGARIAVPYLEKRGGGVILNASSLASLLPGAQRGAYCAAKAGINVLTRVLAAELAPRNIRVVAYLPGMIEVPRLQKRLASEKDKLVRDIPLRRCGRPEEVASTVVFLASERASYITGVCVPVTGGKFCVQNVTSVF